ncbi:ketopantoate reductase PanE/ApbA C terminal-domain-containing protein [Epithele typhae]|uniref:ketopantoate reductase PanE/ApbA C terminal-domain-containing protein n=1 Tax=Epithele typhae TaxID=378194 RepID=UPI002008B322|nr:ketopantoate reductase PanE/ApbA C terminal-domain-containing protein [Epithele typhae]KAH9944219.1 ketopantoate reductase PanE/ApbA C terminal-domain-containing protein [Epithele typhae]
MRIHIAGLGAVGTFVAYHLRHTLTLKDAVVALHRKEVAPALSRSWPVLKVSSYRGAVVASEHRVLHTVYHTTPERWTNLVPMRHLSLADQARGEKELELHRPWDPHKMPRVGGSLESLILTTKAHQASGVIAALRGLISRNTTIVLLVNGMGLYEQLVDEHFPDPEARPNFVLATNTHGFFRPEPFHVVHSGTGEIQLGIVPDPLGRNYEAALLRSRDPFVNLSLDDIERSEEVPYGASRRYRNLRYTIAALTGARALGASWRPYSDVRLNMQRKLVVNAFVNPVSALMQCRNGETLAATNGHWLMQRLCREAEATYRGHFEAEVRAQREEHLRRLRADDTLPPFIASSFPTSLKHHSLQAEIERVVEQTKNNYSSMSVDIKTDRGTEIEYINGYLHRLASKYRVNTWVNDTLYHLINMRSLIPFVPGVQTGVFIHTSFMLLLTLA